jgi:hypothetical protein
VPAVDSAQQRDNLLRTIRFERPDYVPMTFHINDACWHHYPHEALWDLMESHPLLFPGFQRPAIATPRSYAPYARAGVPFLDPWGCVWETTDDGLFGTVTRHPLATWDNFHHYEPPDANHFTHWLPIDWERQHEQLGPAISQRCLRNGEIGHNHTWLRLIDIRGYENVLYDMADGEPRLRRLLEMLEQFNLQLVRNYITWARAEWMGFAEDLGMQQGPMLSPQHFRTFILPSYRRIMSAASDAGCIVHVHSDGDLRLLIDELLTLPIHVLNLQDLVNGVAWIKERLKGRICIDLDIDRQSVTVAGTPRQIDDLIRQEVAELGSRAGGLLMIYGLYPGVPLANAAAVMDAMERYATYYN